MIDQEDYYQFMEKLNLINFGDSNRKNDEIIENISRDENTIPLVTSIIKMDPTIDERAAKSMNLSNGLNIELRMIEIVKSIESLRCSLKNEKQAYSNFVSSQSSSNQKQSRSPTSSESVDSDDIIELKSQICNEILQLMSSVRNDLAIIPKSNNEMKDSIAECMKIINNQTSFSKESNEKLQYALASVSIGLDEINENLEAHIKSIRFASRSFSFFNKITNFGLSIMIEKSLLSEQITYFNEKLMQNYCKDIDKRLKFVAKNASKSINTAISSSNVVNKLLEFKSSFDNCDLNQFKVKPSLNTNCSDIIAKASTNLQYMLDRIKDIQLDLKKLNHLQTNYNQEEFLNKTIQQLKSDIDTKRMKYQFERQEHLEKLNKLKELEDEVKDLLSTDYFNGSDVAESNMPNNNISERKSNHIVNIQKVTEYTECLNSKIKDYNRRVKLYGKKFYNWSEQNNLLESSQQQCNLEIANIREIITECTEKIQEIEEMKDKIQNEIEEINKMNIKEIQYKGVNLIIRMNSITNEKVNAIVNPTNDKLDFSVGDSKVVYEIGGQEIKEDCSEYLQSHHRLHAGSAMITRAGNLPCDYVIHTVGPVYNPKSSLNPFAKQQILSVVNNTLKIAVEKNLKSVSIPAVTGKILGYPIKESKLIGSIIKCYIDSNQNQIEGKTIIICINDDKTLEAFEKNEYKIFEHIEDSNYYTDYTQSQNSDDSKKSNDSFHEERKFNLNLQMIKRQRTNTFYSPREKNLHNLLHNNDVISLSSIDEENEQSNMDRLHKSFSYNSNLFH